MILVDTSVWIDVLRDRTGRTVDRFREKIGAEHCVFCRFTQLELLQGAKDEKEWIQLDEYLSTQLYIEATERTWRESARIYFELRRKGVTLNSPVDCCIAQIAIESEIPLLHRNEDFEHIARIRPLAVVRFYYKLSQNVRIVSFTAFNKKGGALWPRLRPYFLSLLSLIPSPCPGKADQPCAEQ